MARLALVRETYGAPELVTHPDAFFVPPPGREPACAAPCARSRGGRECLEASWASAFEPFAPGVRDAYLAHVPNRTAHARLYVGGGPRPAAILVHGYMSGQWAIEERAWPIRWLNQRGLDVALAVLPFHGVRARAEGGRRRSPGADPRFTNEGFRQAVADLRVLIALLQGRGATAVGLMGMSLGGYTTALMATLRAGPRVRRAAHPALVAGGLRARSGAARCRRERRGSSTPPSRRPNHVVSPFARPSRVAAGARARRRRRGGSGDADRARRARRGAPAGAAAARRPAGTSCRRGGRGRSAR